MLHCCTGLETLPDLSGLNNVVTSVYYASDATVIALWEGGYQKYPLAVE